jgi:hypothetical protein
MKEVVNQANQVVLDNEVVWLTEMLLEQERLEGAIVTCGCINCHRLLDWVNQEIDKEVLRIRIRPAFDHEQVRDVRPRG